MKDRFWIFAIFFIQHLLRPSSRERSRAAEGAHGTQMKLAESLLKSWVRLKAWSSYSLHDVALSWFLKSVNFSWVEKDLVGNKDAQTTPVAPCKSKVSRVRNEEQKCFIKHPETRNRAPCLSNPKDYAYSRSSASSAAVPLQSISSSDPFQIQ